MDTLLNVSTTQAVGDIGWVWIIPIVFLVFLFFGIWMRSQGKGLVTTEKPLASAVIEPRSQPRPRSGVVETAAPLETPRLDDLVLIEGIGPKIASILSAAGITTFAGLAAATPERLAEILKASSLRVPTDPTTWPEQAALAATSRWEDLRLLQDDMKGGRKA